MDNVDKYLQMGLEMVIQYAPKLILALIVLLVGLWVIKFLISLMSKALELREADETLRKFLTNLLGWVLKAVLLISIISMLGIETTSFIAILGAAGLAIGLALQGSLANFAGGILILLFKPFKVGDKIESMGRTGDVKEIQILNTVVFTGDGKTVILPNGAIMNGAIVNYTVKGLMRVDLTIGISYDSDIKKAKDLLIDVMHKHPKVLKDPAPFVGVLALADSAVNLTVRPHTYPEDYWIVYFDVLEASKQALDEGGISIPFPQMDVHMTQHS